MPKRSLNLSLDEATVERARRYASRHGTSISRLVDDYLAGLPDTSEPGSMDLTPGVRRLLGIGSGDADLTTWREHLLEKHRP